MDRDKLAQQAEQYKSRAEAQLAELRQDKFLFRPGPAGPDGGDREARQR